MSYFPAPSESGYEDPYRPSMAAQWLVYGAELAAMTGPQRIAAVPDGNASFVLGIINTWRRHRGLSVITVP
jgi:hypothetical protein